MELKTSTGFDWVCVEAGLIGFVRIDWVERSRLAALGHTGGRVNEQALGIIKISNFDRHCIGGGIIAISVLAGYDTFSHQGF